MDTIFTNSENSEASEPHVLILRLTDKLLPYQISASITHEKTWKARTITINIKYQHQHGMINLNYLMTHILYQIFKIILSTFKKTMEKILINHQ